MAIISSFGLFCLTMIFCIGVTSYIVYSRKRRRDEEMNQPDEQNAKIDVEVYVHGKEGMMDYVTCKELPQTDHEISLSETTMDSDSDLIENVNLPESRSQSDSGSETSDDESDDAMYEVYEPGKVGHQRQETPLSKIGSDKQNVIVVDNDCQYFSVMQSKGVLN
eukprot:228797_1